MRDQEEPAIDKPMTEEEKTAWIKKIVLGICDNLVFTDRHCATFEDIKLAFAVLNFLDAPLPEDTGILFEWYEKACTGQSINGYPIFFSVNMANKVDAERIWKAVDAEMERRKEIKV